MLMKINRSLLFRILLLVPAILSLSAGFTSCGNSNSANTPLTVLSITGGNVSVQKSGSGSWIDGKEGLTMTKGDRIKTDSGGKAVITFFDGSIIELNGDTEISLDELIAKSASSPKTIKIGQKIGETTSTIVKLVDPASKYEINTQSGVAAVRGSKMFVKVASDNTTSVYNLEGSISFTAQGNTVLIPVGSGSSAKPGEVPSAPQPGLPSGIGTSGVTSGLISVSSLTGWQQTNLQLNAGDKFYVEYRGGSWSVNIHGYPYVGPLGLPADIDNKVDNGSKITVSVPYGYLIGKVGSGNVINIGNKGGPFTADASGFLSLRMNDGDKTLGDNDGAITVAVRAIVYSALHDFSTTNGNPNGNWSYGWMPADFSKFNIYSAHGAFMWYGNIGRDLTPYIWNNTGDLTNGVPPGLGSTNGIASGVPTGWLSLHPGPGTEPSVLRWTAPVAGSVHVTGQFLAGDSGIMTVAVRHNSQEVWKATNSGSFDLNIKISEGDNVDFAVYGGYGYGNTPISATISYGN
jgi:hypothetical protein